MTGWANMRHDLSGDPEITGWGEMSVREKVKTWVTYYWWPTRRWMPKVEEWWDYNVLRIPKPPPMAEDRVALHFGFVEGVPPCTDGPVCAEHGWELSPLLTAQSDDAQSGANPDDQPRRLRPESVGSERTRIRRSIGRSAVRRGAV